MTENALPNTIFAHWLTSNWDEKTDTASQYWYTDEEGNPINITQAEASRYDWDFPREAPTGGKQRGTIKKRKADD